MTIEDAALFDALAAARRALVAAAVSLPDEEQQTVYTAVTAIDIALRHDMRHLLTSAGHSSPS